MRYEVGQVYDIPLDELTRAKWNPPVRVQKIASLIESIRDNGQMVPILATADLHVSDGHRRIAALREIGIPTVRVLIVDTSQKESYAIVNSTQRPLSARDAMQAYVLGGPKACAAGIRMQMARLEAAIGKPGMELAVAHGFGPTIDRTARYVVKMCGRDLEDISNYRKVVYYLINHKGATNYLRAVQDRNIFPKPLVIWQAIDRNQPFPARSAKQRKALKKALRGGE